MAQKLVKDYMTKSKNLVTFKPGDRIFTVIKSLIKNSISGAPVVDEKGHLVGVISEKDCLKVQLEMAMHDMPGGHVDKYMSNKAVSIDHNRSIMDAVEMFLNTNYRRFPVVDGSKLVGLISRRDILKAIEEGIHSK